MNTGAVVWTSFSMSQFQSLGLGWDQSSRPLRVTCSCSKSGTTWYALEIDCHLLLNLYAETKQPEVSNGPDPFSVWHSVEFSFHLFYHPFMQVSELSKNLAILNVETPAKSPVPSPWKSLNFEFTKFPFPKQEVLLTRNPAPSLFLEHFEPHSQYTNKNILTEGFCRIIQQRVDLQFLVLILIRSGGYQEIAALFSPELLAIKKALGHIGNQEVEKVNNFGDSLASLKENL